MRHVAKHPILHSPSTTPRTDAHALDWHICEDDREWIDVTGRQSTRRHASANNHYESSPSARQRTWLRSYTPAACILLVLMVLLSWRLWWRAHAGLAEVETELETAVVNELWRDRTLHSSATAAEANALNMIETVANLGETITQVEIRTLGRDWAVVEVTLQPTPDGPTFRQTRLYQENEGGWVRGEIVAACWGAMREFESEHFVFQYRVLDEDAVMQTAPKLDALYPELLHSLVLQLPTDAKPIILVDPAMRPGIIFPYNDRRADMVVASPAAALVPSDLATDDVLLQSLVMEAYKRFDPSVKVDRNATILVYRLGKGHRLWLIWERELPLAIWREPLVRWVFAAPEAEMSLEIADVPVFAKDVCAYHTVWMDSPIEVGVPIHCRQTNGQENATSWFDHPVSSDLALDWLIYVESGYFIPLDFWIESVQAEPSPAGIMLATMFEYVADTYGEDTVTLLLHEIPAHKQAETLIPAIFDVPLTEFTDGWRAFVMERYKIQQLRPTLDSMEEGGN